MFPTRRLNPGEAHACFVGSGECLINAAYEMDDGKGSPVYICIPHKLEFETMEALISTMPPEKVAKFKKAIDDASKSA